MSELRVVTAHDHDGRCSGRLRLVAGRIVREIVCDDCGTVVAHLGSAPYQVPVTEEQVHA